jgi:hypothetical protein
LKVCSDHEYLWSYEKLSNSGGVIILMVIAQASVDVPWSPYDADGRNYDWLGLASAADLLVVMAYDMQAEVKSTTQTTST